MDDDQRDSGREDVSWSPRFESPFDASPEDTRRERLEFLSTDPFDCAQHGKPESEERPRPPR